MTINAYSFGRINIDGTDYDADVVVFPDRVRDHWWRREGHSLCMEDLEAVVKESPQVLVLGTGYYGRMQVPQETLNELRARGIEVKIHRTSDAVAELNRLLQETARVVAALHLTC